MFLFIFQKFLREFQKSDKISFVSYFYNCVNIVKIFKLNYNWSESLIKGERIERGERYSMETQMINGVLTLKVDMIQSAALGVIMYYFGVWVRSQIPVLVRLSVPAPAIGGLLIAFLVAFLQSKKILGVTFDGTIQSVLMVMFFCTVGMNASYKLLLKGGLMIAGFWAVATLVAVLQNIAGVSIAKIFGLDPLMGIIGGSVTMIGGLGTAGAFGPLFENEWGVKGAAAAGIACATFGMVAGSLLGGPLAEWIIKTHKIQTPHAAVVEGVSRPRHKEEDESYHEEVAAMTQDGTAHIEEEEPVVSGPHLMKNLSWIIIAMGIGAAISLYLKKSGITLPGYLGAMMAAVVIRNIGDATKAYEIDTKAVGMISDISLAVFVTMAINSLKLWQLIDLAIPLLIMMVAQCALLLLMAYFLVFWLFGRDYDATVMAAGLMGFGLGATPNALVNMQAVSAKYGYAARAFFVVPIVGAFLIDFTNATAITFISSFFR